MYIDREDVAGLDSRKRANLINSISGFRQPFVVGTISGKGIFNAAVFNSVCHIGANPPYLGMIFRPTEGYRRDTYENIKSNGLCALSIVTEDLFEQAHKTSAKFSRETDEFAECNLAHELVGDFAAPFVLESPVKIGLRFAQENKIEVNSTVLVVFAVEFVVVSDGIVNEQMHVDIGSAGAVPISGLYSYYENTKLKRRLTYVEAND